MSDVGDKTAGIEKKIFIFHEKMLKVRISMGMHFLNFMLVGHVIMGGIVTCNYNGSQNPAKMKI